MTQNTTAGDDRGRPVINTLVGGKRFEVFETTGDGDGYGYVGYCDGERSVVATRADIAARALAIKHCKAEADEDKVVSLCAVRARRNATIH